MGLWLACGFLFSSSTHALSNADIQHLVGRAAFGISQADSEAFKRLSRAQSVERLMAQAAPGCEASSIPEWAENRWESAPATDAASQLAHIKLRYAHRVALQTWWINGMLASPAPLCEHMALFWHQYFPIPIHQTTSEAAAVRQVQRFRRDWAGNFRDILLGMSRDPAMQEFLGLISNRKGHPNENFARELLELYTLGPGYYSEQDIREAARAYTGWRTVRRLGMFVVWWPDHDFGVKTFLGQSGRWDGDDIVRMVLAQPRTAEFVVEKLWHEFVSPVADPVEVSRLAAGLRQDWEIRPVLELLLKSEAFWAPAARLTLVKSPVELAVGTLRQAGVSSVSGNALAAWSWAMGQGLYFPPDVKGWRGDSAWITVQTLQTRDSFLRGLAESYTDDMIAALQQQVYEYPGFDEQSLAADSRRLQQALPQTARQWLLGKLGKAEYQVK